MARLYLGHLGRVAERHVPVRFPVVFQLTRLGAPADDRCAPAAALGIALGEACLRRKGGARRVALANGEGTRVPLCSVLIVFRLIHAQLGYVGQAEGRVGQYGVRSGRRLQSRCRRTVARRFCGRNRHVGRMARRALGLEHCFARCVLK